MYASWNAGQSVLSSRPARLSRLRLRRVLRGSICWFGTWLNPALIHERFEGVWTSSVYERAPGLCQFAGAVALCNSRRTSANCLDMLAQPQHSVCNEPGHGFYPRRIRCVSRARKLPT